MQLSSLSCVQGGSRFPWDEESVEVALCGNTCAAANNGVCDEGRLPDYGAVAAGGLMVLCDPGSDCADCGPFKFNVTGVDATYEPDTPIKRLVAQKVRMRHARDPYVLNSKIYALAWMRARSQNAHQRVGHPWASRKVRAFLHAIPQPQTLRLTARPYLPAVWTPAMKMTRVFAHRVPLWAVQREFI